MKRIVASVGLVALGTSGLQAASTPSFMSPQSKPWMVSATLRGFYDDNINSLPDNVNPAPFHRGSFGYEVSPSIILNWPREQTSLNAGYVFDFRQYENKPFLQSRNYDMTHTFNVALDHAFNEMYQVNVRDSFVVGQEPDFLRAGPSLSTFSRVNGDNYRNYGAIALDGKLTRLFGFELGYDNSFYRYADNQFLDTTTTPPTFVGSTAGRLDRIEHVIHLDTRWQLLPQTVGLIGYQFSETDFTADQELSSGSGIFSDARNNRGHYVYVGAEQTFRPDLTGAIRAGARYTDYYNAAGDPNNVAPYVKLSLRWTYGPESYLEGGFIHDRTATDLFSVDPANSSNFTLDAESSIVYASINHRLAPNLYVSATGQFQDSVYNGGPINDQSDRYYAAGINLEYRFNQNLSTHVGYNYDKLDSDVGRTFDRNRVYLGVTASY